MSLAGNPSTVAAFIVTGWLALRTDKKNRQKWKYN